MYFAHVTQFVVLARINKYNCFITSPLPTFFNVLNIVQTHCQRRMLYFIWIKRESGTNKGWKGGLSISSPSSGHSCARTNVQIWNTAQICLCTIPLFFISYNLPFYEWLASQQKPPAGRIKLSFFYRCNWGFWIRLMVHIHVLVKRVH